MSNAAALLNPWCKPLLIGGPRSLPRAVLEGWPVAIRLSGLRRTYAGGATHQLAGHSLLRTPCTASRCSTGDAAAGGGTSPDFDALPSRADTAEMSSRIAKLGLAAVLAYGLFDGVTYTSFFTLAFLGYEKSTGKNPAANLKALLGIVILMWTGNNVTRPFRVAGAAALAPAIDKLLKRIQTKLNLPSQIYAFALVVGGVGGICFSVVGLLILSRWGK
ncbi:unnamed protein product [Spirodela intermedia]|uniref:Uncharacterized protein n=1 Tax=Spirodela intermedia TaxID=51605 RepID=A0A7I8L3F1_SPIIN|nr:unnamed protein product [Spirodela intermedia]